MEHRRFLFILLLAAPFFQTSFSQTVIDPRILSSASRVEKMVHLDSVIRFTAKEARLFWPIYNQYMWRWEKLMGDRINFIQNNIEEQEATPVKAVSLRFCPLQLRNSKIPTSARKFFIIRWLRTNLFIERTV